MITSVQNSIGSIPQDLVIEILLRIPTKPLLRFKLVSKTWCSIIRNQQFIDRYMSISMSRPRLLLVFKRNHNEENQLIFFSSAGHHDKKTHGSIAAKHEMTISKPSSVGDNNYKVRSNSVRGLICCSTQNQFMVCNPATKQVINLPHHDHMSDRSNVKCYMYLGYDTSNDQYKVLRVTRQPSNNKVYDQSVYTLGCKQSSWRHVENGMFNHIPSYNSVYIDGVVYYESKMAPFSRSVRLVSFDFVSERFDEIIIPQEFSIYPSTNVLLNYEGNLAAFSFLENGGFCLWVFDKARNNRSLTKANFDFPPCFHDIELSLSGATNVGELVFVSESHPDGFSVFFYDLKKRTIRGFKVEGDANDDEFRFGGENLRHVPMSCGHVAHVDNIRVII